MLEILDLSCGTKIKNAAIDHNCHRGCPSKTNHLHFEPFSLSLSLDSGTPTPRYGVLKMFSLVKKQWEIGGEIDPSISW